MFSGSCSPRYQCRYWFWSPVWPIEEMHRRDHGPLYPGCCGRGRIAYWQTTIICQPDSATLHCISDFLSDKWNNNFCADHLICYPINNIYKWDWFRNWFAPTTWDIQKYAKSWKITQRLKYILSLASDSDFANLHH